MKLGFISFLLLMPTMWAMADDSYKLSGTVIGTAESVDYSTSQKSTTVNTREMAFDGDLNTCFASWERSYTWTGLDLGTSHVITRVGWSPRNDSQGEKRVLLGVFEGANREDFMDALPLYIIKEKGTIGQMSYATVDCSRGFPKKPYRIKFDKKQNVLDAPAKAKKWTLINNYGDKTLMRNLLAFELSRKMGMPYTPYGTAVDVLLNGEYKGCYQLCDQIEVKSGRVDITEMTPEDNTGEALTGGYLIEVDAYAYDEPSMFTSNKGNPVTIKSPDDDAITTNQYEYIRQYFNKMENQWKTYLDLNTFLRHFLVGELSGNTDTYWSTYMYKDRGDDKIYTGPVWDFDLAFENDNRTYPIMNLKDWIYRTKGSCAGNMRTFVNNIVVNNSAAKAQLKEIWGEVRQAGLTEEYMTDYIDAWEQTLGESQELNFMRWPIMNQYVHQNPRLWGSYQAEVQNVRRYMKERITLQTAQDDCHAIYDLSGRQVDKSKMKAGVYISNGKKFVVK